MAKLYFRYGVMGSSKSANALMVRYNYEERGQRALMVKPVIDQREGERIVNSRIGLRYPCIWFEELEEMTPEEIREYRGTLTEPGKDSPYRNRSAEENLELFENMKRICEGRTVIFISHRLSSAISADVIFMMEQGRIIERGNHESLMRQNGKYAEMFRKQAEKYE